MWAGQLALAGFLSSLSRSRRAPAFSPLFPSSRSFRAPSSRRSRTLDVEVVLGEDLGALVDGLAGAVEDTAEHVLGHGDLERVARELDAGLAGVDAGGALEHLDDGAAAGDLEHLPGALGAIGQRQVHDLGELGELQRGQTRGDEGTERGKRKGEIGKTRDGEERGGRVASKGETS